MVNEIGKGPHHRSHKKNVKNSVISEVFFIFPLFLLPLANSQVVTVFTKFFPLYCYLLIVSSTTI